MDLDAIVSDAMTRLADLGQAWDATWTPAAGGAGVPVVLTVAEDPTVPQQAHGQEAEARQLSVYVRADGLPTPAHGDQVAIDAGPYAGTWSVLGVDRRDQLGLLVRLRSTTRQRTAAAGIRQVLR